MKLAEKVKQKHKELGMTQEELAHGMMNLKRKSLKEVIYDFNVS